MPVVVHNDSEADVAGAEEPGAADRDVGATGAAGRIEARDERRGRVGLQHLELGGRRAHRRDDLQTARVDLARDGDEESGVVDDVEVGLAAWAWTLAGEADVGRGSKPLPEDGDDVTGATLRRIETSDGGGRRRARAAVHLEGRRARDRAVVGGQEEGIVAVGKRGNRDHQPSVVEQRKARGRRETEEHRAHVVQPLADDDQGRARRGLRRGEGVEGRQDVEGLTPGERRSRSVYDERSGHRALWYDDDELLLARCAARLDDGGLYLADVDRRGRPSGFEQPRARDGNAGPDRGTSGGHTGDRGRDGEGVLVVGLADATWIVRSGRTM